MSQAELHAAEMNQSGEDEAQSEPLIVHKNWNTFETVNVPVERGGHGGGDKRLHDKIFKSPNESDPYDRAAGVRDGAMSILIGVAARNSIESGEPIRIGALTDLQPRAKRI